MILADTTAWVDFFRGEETAEMRVLQKALRERETVATTDIILTEILRGIGPEKEYRAVERHMRAFPRLSAEAPRTFIHAAQLYRRCLRAGATVRSTVDCLIAAVSIEHGVPLLHHDSDFDLLARHTPLKIVRPPSA